MEIHLTSTARTGLGVTAVVAAAALVLGSTTVAQATPAALHKDGVNFKTRAVTTLLAESRATAQKGTSDGGDLTPSKSTISAAEAKAPTADAPADAPTATPRSLAADAAAECGALGLDWTPTNDHVWLHWTSTGASSYAVWRLRDRGAWKQLGSSTGTTFLDKTVNPRGSFTYRVVAGGLTCDLGEWVSMTTDDGWGVPDAVYGGAAAGDTDTGQLMEQDIYSFAMPSGHRGADPAYALDGRRIAMTQLEAGVWKILVVDPAKPSRGNLAAVSMPAGFIGVDAAWSPDGRTVSYTRYAIDDQGVVSSPEVHLITVETGADQVVAGSQGLIQADWLSATRLVAAGAAVGEGLFTISAAGGTKDPYSNTVNAGYPEVAPNGTTYFVEGDGTDFYLKALDSIGTTRVIRHETTHWFEKPRVAPNGDLYYIEIDGHVLTDPDDNTFSITMDAFDGQGPNGTAIGASRDDSLSGFNGYDVRQPKSKGTSDYVGDANPEILGKDGSGRLWAYYGSDSSPVAGRTSMGGGWNMFNQVVAPGDLDGDNRADVLARKPDGTLWFYRGLGAGKVAAGKQVGSGWSSYVLVAPGDFNGDGKTDLLGRDSKFQLWLYPGKGDATFGARTLVTSGWGGFSAIIGFGDFDFDGRADILGRERSTGYLYLYSGNGSGGLTSRTRLGAGWNSLNAFAAPEFYGITPGLFGRLADGSMRYYEVIADGRFDADSVYPAGGGWGSYQITG
jgi:hypothetical protein